MFIFFPQSHSFVNLTLCSMEGNIEGVSVHYLILYYCVHYDNLVHCRFDPISGTWQHQDSSAPLYPYMGADPLSAASSSPYDQMNVALRDNSHYHMTENRMEPIALKPDNNPDRSVSVIQSLTLNYIQGILILLAIAIINK